MVILSTKLGGRDLTTGGNKRIDRKHKSFVTTWLDEGF